MTLAPHRPSASRGRRLAVFAAAALLLGVVVALLAAVVWAWVATPPQGLVTSRGVFLASEVAFNQQATLSLWFMVVGVGFGALSGLLLGSAGRAFGLGTVVAVLLCCLVAGWLSGWLGIHVFGPDVRQQLATASAGDHVTTSLSVTSVVAYLGWPVGGLCGVLVAIGLWPSEKAHAPGLASSTVVADKHP